MTTSFSAPTISASGQVLTLTLSTAGCLPVAGTGGFALAGTGATVGPWSIAGSTLTANLIGIAGYEAAGLQVVTITGSGGITDSGGQPVTALAAAAVTNSSVFGSYDTTGTSTSAVTSFTAMTFNLAGSRTRSRRNNYVESAFVIKEDNFQSNDTDVWAVVASDTSGAAASFSGGGMSLSGGGAGSTANVTRRSKTCFTGPYEVLRLDIGQYAASPVEEQIRLVAATSGTGAAYFYYGIEVDTVALKINLISWSNTTRTVIAQYAITTLPRSVFFIQLGKYLTIATDDGTAVDGGVGNITFYPSVETDTGANFNNFWPDPRTNVRRTQFYPQISLHNKGTGTTRVSLFRESWAGLTGNFNANMLKYTTGEDVVVNGYKFFCATGGGLSVGSDPSTMHTSIYALNMSTGEEFEVSKLMQRYVSGDGTMGIWSMQACSLVYDPAAKLWTFLGNTFGSSDHGDGTETMQVFTTSEDLLTPGVHILNGRGRTLGFTSAAGAGGVPAGAFYDASPVLKGGTWYVGLSDNGTNGQNGVITAPQAKLFSGPDLFHLTYIGNGGNAGAASEGVKIFNSNGATYILANSTTGTNVFDLTMTQVGAAVLNLSGEAYGNNPACHAVVFISFDAGGNAVYNVLRHNGARPVYSDGTTQTYSEGTQTLWRSAISNPPGTEKPHQQYYTAATTVMPWSPSIQFGGLQ